MIWNEILCLGDSITYGARDSQKRSFPAELSNLLQKSTGEFYYGHNYGVCGETSSDLLRRVWGVTKSNTNAKIATVLIGTNDIQIPITERVYEDNIRQIISCLHVHGMHVVLCTLPQLGKTPLYLKNLSFIQKYNEILFKLSREYETSICDIRGTEKYYIDGVHYTHEGYNVLAELIAKTILNITENEGV